MVSVLAGASLPLAFAPVNFFPLALIAPAILFWLWLDSLPKQAFITGYLIDPCMKFSMIFKFTNAFDYGY